MSSSSTFVSALLAVVVVVSVLECASASRIHHSRHQRAAIDADSDTLSKLAESVEILAKAVESMKQDSEVQPIEAEIPKPTPKPEQIYIACGRATFRLLSTWTPDCSNINPSKPVVNFTKCCTGCTAADLNSITCAV